MPTADRETAHSREHLAEARERQRPRGREREERGIQKKKEGILCIHSATGSLMVILLPTRVSLQYREFRTISAAKEGQGVRHFSSFWKSSQSRPSVFLLFSLHPSLLFLLHLFFLFFKEADSRRRHARCRVPSTASFSVCLFVC